MSGSRTKQLRQGRTRREARRARRTYAKSVLPLQGRDRVFTGPPAPVEPKQKQKRRGQVVEPKGWRR